jgi:hypothetical protein
MDGAQKNRNRYFISKIHVMDLTHVFSFLAPVAETFIYNYYSNGKMNRPGRKNKLLRKTEFCNI